MAECPRGTQLRRGIGASLDFVHASSSKFLDTTVVRLLVAGIVGGAVAAAVAANARWGHSLTESGCVLMGWVAAVVVYLVWTWVHIWPMSGLTTKSHAKSEDPTRWVSYVIMTAASAASIGGVGHLLIAGSRTGRESVAAAGVGVASVVAVWLLVHTVFTLHYAHLYYVAPSSVIDFNEQDLPAYSDFAYLAFTIGMAYAVSDTTLRTRAIRKRALVHGLISYLLGAVIVASTINLLVGLGPRG